MGLTRATSGSGNLCGVAGARGRGLASAIAVVVVVCGAPSRTSYALTAPSVAAQVLDAAKIHDEQIAVVNRNDLLPIVAAQGAVAAYQANISRDHQGIADDAAAATSANAAHQAASANLAADTPALAAAEANLQQARGQVETDRERLRALAVGTYTGELTNPPPSGSPAPEAAQQAAIDVAEVSVIAGIVDRRLRADIVSVGTATQLRDRLTMMVNADQQQLTSTAQAESAATANAAVDSTALAADQRGLSAAGVELAEARSRLTADLASISGPSNTPAGVVSLLGGSALSPAQLADWYHWSGYSDLTSAPIEQLAGWYVQSGNQLGLRGDVAFAQAILETGGFSSPDAVDLNNYAGIGHCDSCASGWQFPSPNGGVVGQIQLLRIFATTAAAPAGAPGPVLPSLTVSQQHEAGCCPSVESLTGVWATDPTYDGQILGIYQQMLEFVLSQR